LSKYIAIIGMRAFLCINHNWISNIWKSNCASHFYWYNKYTIWNLNSVFVIPVEMWGTIWFPNVWNSIVVNTQKGSHAYYSNVFRQPDIHDFKYFGIQLFHVTASVLLVAEMYCFNVISTHHTFISFPGCLTKSEFTSIEIQ
jgi:hypothetical protein